MHSPYCSALEVRLLAFQSHYERIAEPFDWKFTCDDLGRLLDQLDQPEARGA
jgi:hypothetical protein